MGRVADATAPAPGYPRDSVGQSDDAITFATARSANNGAPRVSVVGVVPPQPVNMYGHAQNGGGHMAVVRLILRLSSSE